MGSFKLILITVVGTVLATLLTYYWWGIGKSSESAPATSSINQSGGVTAGEIGTLVQVQKSDSFSEMACPLVPIQYDEQGFFLENRDNQAFILEETSERALGDTSISSSKSMPNIQIVLNPGEKYRINLGILGYNRSISYEINVRLRNLKANKAYNVVYEIKADVIENGTELTNHRTFHKGCSEL